MPDYRKLAAEYSRRAREARRMANTARTPAEKADILEVENQWLRLARNQEAKFLEPLQRKQRRRGRPKN